MGDVKLLTRKVYLLIYTWILHLAEKRHFNFLTVYCDCGIGLGRYATRNILHPAIHFSTVDMCYCVGYC